MKGLIFYFARKKQKKLKSILNLIKTDVSSEKNVHLFLFIPSLAFSVFHRCVCVYVYIYIYIVIHIQICFVLSELISAARQARFPKLGSKPGWLKRQSKILPLSHKETSTSERNLNGYESQLLLFRYIRLTVAESSIHVKSLAYTLMATQLLHSLESSILQR